jgi:hypothetical protein
MNISLVIELKKEYTCQVTHILAPLIYDGLNAIYAESAKNENNSRVLKDFQGRLKLIKMWSNETVKIKTNTILESTKISTPWFINLIQALFKVTQIMLGLEARSELIKELNIMTFIHHVYIESAREFWMDPYLFYHEYTSLEIKHNNNMVLLKINTAIENAIRRLLPMGVILSNFLGDSAINSKELNINELYNMPLLLEISLDKTETSSDDTSRNVTTRDSTTTELVVEKQQEPVQMTGGDIKSNKIENVDNISVDTNRKILNIIDNQDFKLSETNDIVSNKFIKVDASQKTHKSINSSSSVLKKIIHESLHKKSTQGRSSEADSLVKNVLLKNLDSETEKIHPSDQYQDIFSNSERRETVNHSDDFEQKKKRDKFFNNYLNI